MSVLEKKCKLLFVSLFPFTQRGKTRANFSKFYIKKDTTL